MSPIELSWTAKNVILAKEKKNGKIFGEGNNFLAEKKNGEGKEENIWRWKIFGHGKGGKYL